jgi:hypothetical protein
VIELSRVCFGCLGGCAASRERKHEPSDVPAPPPEADETINFAALPPEQQALFYRLDEANRQQIAYHEAGHVIATAYYRRGTEYVTIGAFPHQCADALSIDEMSPQALEELLAVQYLAGNVAGGIAQHRITGPTDDQLNTMFAKIRGSDFGNCDEFTVARLLIALTPNAADEELRARWNTHWRTCVDLLERFEFRVQLRRVATALLDKVLLTRADLDLLVDPDALRASQPWAETPD